MGVKLAECICVAHELFIFHFPINCICLNGGAFELSKESNNSIEASADKNNIGENIENNAGRSSGVDGHISNDAPCGGSSDLHIVNASGISAASIGTKLETLPEVELLTAELMAERRGLSVPPEQLKKVKKDCKHRSEKDLLDNREETQEIEPESREMEITAEHEHGKIDKSQSACGDRTEDNTKNTRKWKIIRAALLTAAVVVLGFIAFEAVSLANIFNSVHYVKNSGTFDHTDVVVSQSAIAEYVSHSDETKNILLVGYDVDEYGVSRSDSMIILTLDHENQKIKMTSLMRDMYVSIPNHGRHKLNAAFVYGGPELLLQTIYSNFGLRIDNYVCVDYAAFVDVVDYIGGVQMDIEEIELEQFNKYVRGGSKNKIDEAGSYVFNGQQALSYCRIRKVGSDTARTARQREVLSKIMKRCSGMSLLKLEKLLKITAPAVTTNLTQADIFRFTAEGLSSMDYDMQGMRIPVDGAWQDLNLDGIWYVDIDLNANARYLHDFIYGDSETSDRLAANLMETDAANEEREKADFEKKNAGKTRRD